MNGDYQKVTTTKIASSYPCPRCGGRLPDEYGVSERGYRTPSLGDRPQETLLPHEPSRIKPRERPRWEAGRPAAVFRRKLEPVKRYLVTAAQNATPLHDGFWKTSRKRQPTMKPSYW